MILYIILQVARGMSHLESRNIVHCGLQARKILIGEDGEVKVSGLEYGTSKSIDRINGPGLISMNLQVTRTQKLFNQNAPFSIYIVLIG
jgi:serine/threonine protein kinase